MFSVVLCNRERFSVALSRFSFAVALVLFFLTLAFAFVFALGFTGPMRLGYAGRSRRGLFLALGFTSASVREGGRRRCLARRFLNRDGFEFPARCFLDRFQTRPFIDDHLSRAGAAHRAGLPLDIVD